MSNAPGFANLRDVSVGVSGGRVRSGVLFRSDAPFDGDEAPALTGWPPAAVIDLRDTEGQPHPLASGSRVHVLPILGAASPDQMRAAIADEEQVTRIYRSMVKPKGAAFLVRAIEIIAEESGAVLVHCAAGKDRTGVTVAFALRLCGIDREAVLLDYLLTDHAADALYHRIVHHFGLEVEQKDLPHHMLHTSRAALEAALDVWDEAEGGTEGYYLAHGGTPAILAKLRARLLDG